MNFINAVFGYPLGWIMWAIYHIVSNYGIALIIFTLITKLLLVPLMIKQQKSMAKQTAFQPKMTELQTKYKNNKEKLNEEMMKLYEEEGFNPMSGCLPMLVQFPILFGLIDVIYHPLKHIMRFSGDLITQATAIVTEHGITGNVYSPEITIINAVKANPEYFSSLGSDFVSKVQGINFLFMGMDLSLVPTFELNMLLIIPIFSGLTSLALSISSIWQQKKNMGDNKQAGSGMMNGMMLLMPIMSLVIAFQVPAGVGMYWIFTNVFSLVQTILLNKFYNPKEMAAAAAAESERKREEARQKKIEAKKMLREQQESQQGEAVLSEEVLSQKEKNRRRLAEARKRDAERYGEEYVEVTDEDLK